MVQGAVPYAIHHMIRRTLTTYWSPIRAYTHAHAHTNTHAHTHTYAHTHHPHSQRQRKASAKMISRIQMDSAELEELGKELAQSGGQTFEDHLREADIKDPKKVAEEIRANEYENMEEVTVNY